MSVLRNLETKLADLVEGTFGRVFRSAVRPVEVARKLAREMDEHKTVSVSRTYVPNEYAVWLSPRDRENFAEVEHELSDELGVPGERAQAGPSPAEFGHTMVHSAADRIRGPVEETSPRRPVRAAIV